MDLRLGESCGSPVDASDTGRVVVVFGGGLRLSVDVFGCKDDNDKIANCKYRPKPYLETFTLSLRTFKTTGKTSQFILIPRNNVMSITVNHIFVFSRDTFQPSCIVTNV